MVRRAASNMRKDLNQSFRNYYAAWPLQRAAVCIVTNHRLQPLQGKCRNSTQGMCHYCTGERDSVSCSCPSRHKSTDTSRHQQLRSEKGNMQVVQRTKKKNTQLLHLLWWTHLQRAPSDMLQVLLERLNIHTHTHTILTLNTSNNCLVLHPSSTLAPLFSLFEVVVAFWFIINYVHKSNAE